MLPEPLLWYTVLRILAGAVAAGAVVMFIITYLRRTLRYKALLRTLSVVTCAGMLLVLLFVTSPLDYRATAPAPTDAKLYTLSDTNDLATLRAADGSRTFIRHLSGGPGQTLAYDVDGLLITYTYGLGRMVTTQGGYSTWLSTFTLRAFRRNDGADALPALRALSTVTAFTLAGNVLYVTTIDDTAHMSAETLRAFSLPAGVELWHSAQTTTAPPSMWGVDQGILYVQLDATVAAVRTVDGGLIWQSPPLIASPSGHIEPFAPPHAGEVYVRVVGDGTLSGVSVVKLDARDGSKKWTLPGIAIGAITGNRIYAIRNAKLTAFDASSGVQIWEQHGVEIQHIYRDSAITVASGVLYVVGVRILANGLRIGTCSVIAIRVSDNAELWRRPPRACGNTLPLLEANGMLYYMTDIGDFTAFRVTDGAVLWTSTGYNRGGFFHWSDSFRVGATSPGVVFIDSDHARSCSFFLGCKPNYTGICQSILFCDDPEAGHYLKAVDPATGDLYWRYRWDDVGSYLFDDGSA